MPAAVIKGDFRVFNEPELKITTRPGENDLYYWNDQGYYFYTGDGLYTADFTAKAGEKVYIRLETTDVAEVFVNGTSAGRMIWDPYCLEITDLIKDGENKLEIMVTSTAANLIHGQTPSGVGNVKLFKA